MQVFILEGRTEEQKAAFIAAATEAAATHLDAPADSVRIILTDMPLTNFGKAGKTAKQIRDEKAAAGGSR
jgi:4-oxalocrotonate tautomerase